jgi:hypothetical protein
MSPERKRQDAKWGQQNHPNGTSNVLYRHDATYAKNTCDRLTAQKKLTWLSILMEEFYEAAEEENPERLQKELVQIAAVCTAWHEAIERSKTK